MKFSFLLMLLAVGPGPVCANAQTASPDAQKTTEVLNKIDQLVEQNKILEKQNQLFGTDEVAPSNQEQYLRVYYQYQPLWNLLDATAREKVCKGNYERIFDEARREVRASEKTQVLRSSNDSVVDRRTPGDRHAR